MRELSLQADSTYENHPGTPGSTARSIRAYHSGDVRNEHQRDLCNWPKQKFDALRQNLAAGAAIAGRSGVDITIAPFTNVYVLGEDNDEARWQEARQPLFHYINRMGDFYWNMLVDNGYEAEVSASRAAWQNGRDMAGAMTAISEQMVRDIQVIGPIDSVAEQLTERSSLGADIQMVQMPGGTSAEAGKRLETLLG